MLLETYHSTISTTGNSVYEVEFEIGVIDGRATYQFAIYF